MSRDGRPGLHGRLGIHGQNSRQVAMIAQVATAVHIATVAKVTSVAPRSGIAALCYYLIIQSVPQGKQHITITKMSLLTLSTKKRPEVEPKPNRSWTIVNEISAESTKYRSKIDDKSTKRQPKLDQKLSRTHKKSARTWPKVDQYSTKKIDQKSTKIWSEFDQKSTRTQNVEQNSQKFEINRNNIDQSTKRRLTHTKPRPNYTTQHLDLKSAWSRDDLVLTEPNPT
jgi:hypothetical protein